MCDKAQEGAPEDEDDIINISESEEEEDMAGDQISREQTHPPHHSSTPCPTPTDTVIDIVRCHKKVSGHIAEMDLSYGRSPNGP